MELIGALDHRRLRRELRRREEALRAAAQAPEVARAPEAAEPRAEVSLADEASPEWLAAPRSSSPRNWCECDFCGRGFYGYGQFLNHNCHESG
jgi:hypothetical protein